MKKGWWFPFVSRKKGGVSRMVSRKTGDGSRMIGVVTHGAWVLHLINKDKSDESLLLLAFGRYAVNVIFLRC